MGPEVPLLVADEAIVDTSERTAMCLQTHYRADRCCLSGSVTLIQTRTQHGLIGE
jgi:hypothetical protein